MLGTGMYAVEREDQSQGNPTFLEMGYNHMNLNTTVGHSSKDHN